MLVFYITNIELEVVVFGKQCDLWGKNVIGS
jgi:hypothetical protein